MVPGHEIAGRVVKVGKDVTKFKAGDYAGVGLHGQCVRALHVLRDGQGAVLRERYHVHLQQHRPLPRQRAWPWAGYSDSIVVSERFAVKIPANADLKRVAPLACAPV
ncbi:MAG: alcohol dehydrogenase catalytic domain-containing protein [Alistipes indistinctus]